ncbi:DNA polymerase III subunit epsilon [Gordonibacter sp. An230]|uniref:helicase C-terminal domain-containing protein n=1 Tax=Gordonibacter sp. An230 TaxID=1965592 RepID=UPI000B382BB5|nr:helicase C-terminal domain-containing protein [Gordonibacter sp. An230]OUO92543.1 DNA polymerase III subunit epsilon [Gordonibacter sp. An230]
MDKQAASGQDALQSFISDGTPDLIRARYASLPALAAELDFGELDRSIVVLDTETTGFSFNHDELTQIAAARMDHGEIVEWFVTFVNPGKPIPEEVAHLTNIHDTDVASAPTPDHALADLAEFVGDSKIVAHNAEFDRTFTTRHPSGYPLLENIWIDSLDLARIVVPRLKSHRLLDLVRAFGAPLSTHRADADVAATCAVFRILLAGVAAMPPALVREIARLAPADRWPTQVVFEWFASEEGRRNVSRETFDGSGEDESFSLKNLRRDRIGKLERPAKVDADDIAADPARALKFPTVEDIATAFSPDGLAGLLYKDFEPREEQLIMAKAVRAAFANSENLTVEAGTGVGKSMAYLVPSALTARKNGITVGVATKTNTLLDQLVYHELPALAGALAAADSDNPPLTYAPLKGFSHYPCLRKIGRLVEEGDHMKIVAGKEQSQAPALAALLSFVEQTEYDDMDSLKIDYRVLPRRMVTTTSRDCLRRKCPYFGTSCFVHGARRRAEMADVVVTNHSLLFCDLVADGGLLPPIRYWTVDEAHGAEAEARRAFSCSLSAEDIMRLVNRVSSDEASRNVFVRAERRVVAPDAKEGSTLFYALTAKARAAGSQYVDAAREFCEHLKDLLFFDQNKRGKGYETVELWINADIRQSATFFSISELGCAMSSAAEKLVTASQELVGYLEGLEGAAEIQREIASLAMELKNQVNAVDIILVHPDDSYAYAATLSRKKDRMVEKLEALLINVGQMMNDTLFARTHSVVFASATLAVGDSFDAFESALGLNTSEFSTCRTCRLDSSYDFDGHMTVYVVEDMPEPSDPRYLDALQRLLVDAHRAQQGSMLTLFTNRREMEKCFDEVQPQLKENDLRLVCQKWGVSVKGLRDDFLADERLSLFALKSFWEGFDAPGATLKGVVIPKLPFSKPTDPLSCERAARDDQAWRRYVLPAAVLEVKQAAGRLIRKADDTGVLILADKRLLTKGYGKAFLNSLPSRTIKVLPASAVVEELARGCDR